MGRRAFQVSLLIIFLTFFESAIVLVNKQAQPVYTLETADGLTTAIPIVPIRYEECLVHKFYRLVYTATPKNMSSMMRRIFCALNYLRHGGKDFDGFARRMRDGEGNPCYKSQVRASSKHRRGLHMERTTKIIIWRDPIDRFVSLYEKVADCGEAGESIHVFARAIHKFFKRGKAPHGVRDVVGLRHHAAPQTWYCNVGKNLREYHVIEYTKNSTQLIESLQQTFSMGRIPEEWSSQALALSRLETHQIKDHRDVKSKHDYEEWKREILGTPETLANLLATYYYDYVVFSKELPVPSV